MNDDKRKYWLDDMRNVARIYYGLWAVCAALVLADFFYEKHTYFAWENWTGFHGWYGFVACVALVLAAKQMRKLLRRSEDYYDR